MKIFIKCTSCKKEAVSYLPFNTNRSSSMFGTNRACPVRVVSPDYIKWNSVDIFMWWIATCHVGWLWDSNLNFLNFWNFLSFKTKYAQRQLARHSALHDGDVEREYKFAEPFGTCGHYVGFLPHLFAGVDWTFPTDDEPLGQQPTKKKEDGAVTKILIITGLAVIVCVVVSAIICLRNRFL